MDSGEPQVNSWWIGLSREQMRIEVAKRAEYFASQRAPFLDSIGARLNSDDWRDRPKRRHDAED
jgi:hypothetical protein